MAKDPKVINYGLIGCGAFGLFCLEQYRQMDCMNVVAVADTEYERARTAAERIGTVACSHPTELLARSDIDLIHIATPPFTHFDLAVTALESGKHILCEKPLAIRHEDAIAMLNASRRTGRILAVNLIMRYNPLCEIIKRLVDGKLLGEPLHAFFENYAKDEPLPPDHWFWDRSRSGGIFVEHGVHFFDLFRWWFGDGQILSAHETLRPQTDFVEHVQCIARYGQTVLASFYHGFHQTARMDRQEMRIVFERGSVSLTEWVPTSAKLDAILQQTTLDRLMEWIPSSRVISREDYTGDYRHCTGRHKEYTVDQRVQLEWDTGMTKEALYGHVLRGLMADQIAAIHDPDHKRRLVESDALIALDMAIDADRMARGGDQ